MKVWTDGQEKSFSRAGKRRGRYPCADRNGDSPVMELVSLLCAYSTPNRCWNQDNGLLETMQQSTVSIFWFSPLSGRMESDPSQTVGQVPHPWRWQWPQTLWRWLESGRTSLMWKRCLWFGEGCSEVLLISTFRFAGFYWTAGDKMASLTIVQTEICLYRQR